MRNAAYSTGALRSASWVDSLAMGFVVGVDRFIVSVTKSTGLATYLRGHISNVLGLNYSQRCVNGRYYSI